MNTRCNVIIKKDDNKFFQLYHHHNGFPDGVGVDLEEYIKQMNKDCLSDGEKFVNFLCDPLHQDEYEFEGTKIDLHNDIDFLYFIDLQKHKIYCYSFDLKNTIDLNMSFVDNIINKNLFFVYKHEF